MDGGIQRSRDQSGSHGYEAGSYDHDPGAVPVIPQPRYSGAR